ncbi:Cyclin-D4-1 [Zea mays]|uniref:Cyclin-D4-1 n=1 Tax=Zea mays TaxID=4577 RepID=A0A3L6DAY3_MAIZE|nr:Cyclin-D4-1 [Zea mays]
MDPVGPPLPAEPTLQLQRRRRGETRSCRVPAQQVAAPPAIAGSFGHQITKILQRGMAPSSYEMAASTLLCGEDSSSILDLEAGAQEEEEVLLARSRTRGESSVVFPVPSEDCVAGFMEAEAAHMPREDYAERLCGGGTDLRVRTDTIDWIWKVHAYYSFSPLIACLAVNYLDRFLSLYQLPEGKSWTTQLLSVACLSLAAKMEETYIPPSLDLQLILRVARGTCCLGFRPSEIAAAIAAAVAGEEHAVDIDKSCTHHVHEERVSRCLEAIQATVALLAPGTVPAQPLKAEGPSSGRSRASSSSATVPRSPTGVLDFGCLSYRSDDEDGRFASCAMRPPTIATRCPACHRQSLLRRADGRLTLLGEPPSPRAAHVATAVGTMVVIQGGIGPAGLSAEDLHVLDLTQ